MFFRTILGALVVLAAVRLAYDRRRVEALPRQSAFNETTQAFEKSTKWYKGGLKFLERGRDNQGARVVFTEEVPPNTPLGFQPGKPGSSPYHIHTRQVETVEVSDSRDLRNFAPKVLMDRVPGFGGVLAFMFNGTSGKLPRGETLVVPAGVDHQVWNGEPNATLTIEVSLTPALSSEVFFENLIGVAKDYDTHGTHATPLQMIVLMYDHHMEISTDVALPVRLAIKYILAPLGKLLGYMSMYPEYTSTGAVESLKFDESRRASVDAGSE